MKKMIKKLMRVWNKAVAVLRPRGEVPVKPSRADVPRAEPHPVPAQPVVPKRPKTPCGNWFAGRHVVLDGTNLIYAHQRRDQAGEDMKRLSLAELLGICMGLRRRGAKVKVFFDASTRHHLERRGLEGEKELYLTLIAERPDVFHEVPPKTMADVALLDEVARHLHDDRPGVMISRDLFRDHEADYPFVALAKHRLEMQVRKNGIYFPAVHWLVPCTHAA